MDFFKKRISKSDLLLIGLLAAAGMGGLLFFYATGSRGARIRIMADGSEYGTYSLSADQSVPIRIHGVVTNTLQISEGKAKMVRADCPDQLCVRQNAVSGGGETIVCLPNKIVVEVLGEEESETDAVSR